MRCLKRANCLYLPVTYGGQCMHALTVFLSPLSHSPPSPLTAETGPLGGCVRSLPGLLQDFEAAVRVKDGRRQSKQR